MREPPPQGNRAGRIAANLPLGTATRQLEFVHVPPLPRRVGKRDDASNRYFVLAGLALFERQIYDLNERLERVQEEHFPNRPPVPSHASAIRAGRGFWRGVS